MKNDATDTKTSIFIHTHKISETNEPKACYRYFYFVSRFQILLPGGTVFCTFPALVCVYRGINDKITKKRLGRNKYLRKTVLK